MEMTTPLYVCKAIMGNLNFKPPMTTAMSQEAHWQTPKSMVVHTWPLTLKHLQHTQMVAMEKFARIVVWTQTKPAQVAA